MFSVQNAKLEAKSTLKNSNIDYILEIDSLADLSESNMKATIFMSTLYMIYLGLMIILYFRDRSDFLTAESKMQ
jgi:hypothetical protein